MLHTCKKFWYDDFGDFSSFQNQIICVFNAYPAIICSIVVMGECRVYELAHALFLSLYMYQYHLKIIPYLITDSSILMIVPNFIS